MANSSQVFCGPCDYEMKNTVAVKWCTECQEGLCTECQTAHSRVRVSRDHFIISLDDYRKIENLDIKLDCNIHETKLELFCKVHDEALCRICVSTTHRHCTDIIPINEAAKNSKQSTAMVNLEENVTGLIQKLKSSVDNREHAVASFQQERTRAQAVIGNLRSTLNEKLDECERVLSGNLNDSFNLFNTSHETFIEVLKTKETEFQNILEEISLTKAHASDLQTFVWMRGINDVIDRKSEELKDLKATDYHIEVDISQNHLRSVIRNVEKLGKLLKEETLVELPINIVRHDRAQARIEISTSIQAINIQKVSDLHCANDPNEALALRYSGFRELRYTGCTVLPNGRIFLVSYDLTAPVLHEYDLNGDFRGGHGTLLPSQPFDITAIDDKRVAITLGEDKALVIINVDARIVEKTIRLESSCWGVSYDSGKLYVICKERGILVLNAIGTVLQTIPIDIKEVEYVTACKDKLYYSNSRVHSVVCCNMEGIVQWTFLHESIFHPKGISLDEKQNVLVVAAGSDKLSVISSDGTEFKTLLTDADGLSYPGPVCYIETKKVICLGHRAYGAIVYRVI